MGRSLLISAALCALLGCAQTGVPPRVRLAAAHDDVTCAACHDGAAPASAAAAHSSDAACTASGCHADGGPSDVQLSSVSFRHREHGRSGGRVAPCAACHTHAGKAEDRRLVSAGDACALCHAQQLAGKRSSDCRSCHKDPEHVPVTPQGVPIPHSALAESQTGCLRCHYDVSAPTRTVSSKRCAGCHADKTVAQGVGENLHPAHAGIACTGCHEGAKHRVLAMSSAVVLDCADCHAAAHRVRLAQLATPSRTCTACHAGAHQAQQRLLLGEVPGMPAEPSMKFAAGLNCRSCHTPPAGPAEAQPVRGQASACAGCHRAEYTQVLGWWRQGTRERADLVGAYVRQASAALGTGAPDSARR
ncbi:MAG TPA: cytochrome c3 family protein, partial [Longimicrobiales bacterium]